MPIRPIKMQPVLPGDIALRVDPHEAPTPLLPPPLLPLPSKASTFDSATACRVQGMSLFQTAQHLSLSTSQVRYLWYVKPARLGLPTKHQHSPQDKLKLLVPDPIPFDAQRGHKGHTRPFINQVMRCKGKKINLLDVAAYFGCPPQTINYIWYQWIRQEARREVTRKLFSKK